MRNVATLLLFLVASVVRLDARTPWRDRRACLAGLKNLNDALACRALHGGLEVTRLDGPFLQMVRAEGFLRDVPVCPAAREGARLGRGLPYRLSPHGVYCIHHGFVGGVAGSSCREQLRARGVTGAALLAEAGTTRFVEPKSTGRSRPPLRLILQVFGGLVSLRALLSVLAWSWPAFRRTVRVPPEDLGCLVVVFGSLAFAAVRLGSLRAAGPLPMLVVLYCWAELGVAVARGLFRRAMQAVEAPRGAEDEVRLST